ncbi:MAG: TOMM precursor leader peptide-binding protein [Rubripirellula sp.]
MSGLEQQSHSCCPPRKFLLFAYPRLKSSIDPHAVGRRLFLVSETRSLVFDGPAFPLILPFLDGKHSMVDLQRATDGKLGLPEIFSALRQLENRGCLVDGPCNQDESVSAFYEYGPRAESPPDSLQSVAVQSICDVPAQTLTPALQEIGLSIEAGSPFLVVIADDYLQAELADINHQMLAADRTWMLMKPTGSIVWMGPIMVPGQTGCWSCMAQRLRSNRQTEGYLRNHCDDVTLRQFKPTVPLVANTALNMAALQIANWMARGEQSNLLGNLQTWDLVQRNSRLHRLVKRPQCSECGEPTGEHPPAPIELQSHPKRFIEDGGHRTRTPQETYDLYQHHVSPILGAVTELLPALGQTHALTPSYVAGHNFSMGLDSIVFLRESIRGMSGGKGASDIQAKVSGLCEAIERYSALYTGDEYVIRGSYQDLGTDAIHANEYLGFSERQFDHRTEWNKSQASSRCHMVPEPFPEDKAFDWSPFQSLIDGSTKYLPTALCNFGHPEFSIGGWCLPDSNGSASGNTLEEAILQGFMELVERDAVAIWWYNRLLRPAVDLDSFQLPYLDSIRKYYSAAGRTLWVLDISSDLPISTMACISHRTDRPSEDILLGFGSHFDPKIAILRAITEVNQFLPSVSLTNRDGTTRYLFGDELARQWWTTATMADQPYLAPDPATEPIKLEQIPNLATDDLAEDVRICADMMKEHGMSLFVLDQTQPDLGLSVAKVLVPELCHFWRRLGKPRLHEVPVQMGWLKEPIAEEDLNPFSIFF